MGKTPIIEAGEEFGFRCEFCDADWKVNGADINGCCYDDEMGGYCICTLDCPRPCNGIKCGCRRCHNEYMDFLSARDE